MLTEVGCKPADAPAGGSASFLTAGAVAAALTLAGCWDDDDIVVETPLVVSTGVPASAGVSVAAFISYLMGLSATDESSEPLTLNDTFAIPADESSEPTPR